MPPPPSPLKLLETVPNEILTEILRHLHQPFHFYHYSNALLGISNPTPGLRPWNPVGLQLVSRRWKHIARPLFYRQVAFDARDEVTLDIALRLTEDLLDHPLSYAQDSVWIDVHPSDDLSELSPSSSDSELLDGLQIHVSHWVEANARSVALASNGATSTFSGRTFAERLFVLGNSPLDEAGDTLGTVGGAWDDSGQWNKVGLSTGVHPNHLLILRIPPHGVNDSLTSILEHVGDAPYLPRLRLDLPFPLTSSLLNSVFPILTSILQHPTHPAGRDFILRHTGNPKKIIFGTKSEQDALTLRGRIGELGELEVVVEVVVLEM